LARADIVDIRGHTINPQSLLSHLMFDELFPKKKKKKSIHNINVSHPSNTLEG